MRRPTNRRRFLAAVVATAACLVTACSAAPGPGSGSGGKPVSGGTVTFAENQASGPIDYIFPLVGLVQDIPSNIEFQYLMYRPLYWFGQGSSLRMNNQLSLAYPPLYSDHDTKVTIRLRPYKWSDGAPVSARDVTFWINLLRANASQWALYLPGRFPDDVRSVAAPSSSTVVLTLKRAYAPTWFTQTQLSQIIPIPQQAWDKTSATAKTGNYDQTAAGAVRVYKFLAAQARDMGTYAKSPLWQVVDGPWRLASFQSDGYAALVPNRSYSGPDKPRLHEFVMQPFTSETAEFNALRAGQLTYGYVPQTDLSQKAALSNEGYTVRPWPSWSISYIVLNFNSSQSGALFRQLYIRQALQEMVDQTGWISAFMKGSGNPTYGPVPLAPASSYASSLERSDPYAYHPAAAIALLRSHGWTIRPTGVSTCGRPGTGPGQCGAGVRRGAPLAFSLQYLSGVQYLSQEMLTYQSTLSHAGIKLSLSQGSEGAVLDTATPCRPGPGCTWQMVQWGSPSWIWSAPYPSGEAVFATGAGVNAGNFSQAANDRNIAAVETSSDPAALQRYENYLTRQLPVIWIPNADNQISAYKTSLAGVSQNPLLYLTPEAWYLTH